MANGVFAQKKPNSCTFVIFGVTGDLTHRLVMPSLYNLAAAGLLPERFCVVGVARKGTSNDALRDSLMKGLRQYATRQVDDSVAARLLECVTSIEADPSDPASFDAMKEKIERLEANRSTGGNRLFYLATPPDAFAPIARELGRVGMLKEEDGGAWRRLVVEKPFGTDLGIGEGAQCGASEDPHRAPDLPDRSLSRQGDGAEHPGAALCQRHVRADLESSLHRPCADHGRGEARRRPPRQLL